MEGKHDDDGDQPVENWMETVEDEPLQHVPFGELLRGSFDLYPCYEDYFHALLKNAEIMHIKDPTNRKLSDFLERLEKYVRNEVLVGLSDYSAYNHFLQGELSTDSQLKSAFEGYCQLYDQPQLQLYVKSVKKAADKPLQNYVQADEPKQEATFKNLVAGSEYLPGLNLVLVGQVDHGKSTLLGRFVREFGGQPYTQETLSSFTDIYEKEKQKGKTIEFSTFNLQTKNCSLTIFDTPGHRNYASNMIGALRLADIVVLVVSAKKGEFEAGMNGGTICEILVLANSLGVSRLAVVVSKMSTVEWDRTVMTSIEAHLSKYIAREQLEFSQIRFLPFDSVTNENFKERKIQEYASFIEWLDSLETSSLDKSTLSLRLPAFDIQQIYNTKQIFGKIQSGFLYRSQSITFYPSKFNTTVLSISQGEQKVEFAGNGDFISFTVKNFDNSIQKGTIAANKSEPIITDTLECELHSVGELIVSGFKCIMHLHEIVEEVQVTVESIEQYGRLVRRGFMRRNQKGIVKVRVLKGAVAFEKGLLDRIVLRNYSKTIAFGRVLRSKLQERKSWNGE